MWTILYSFCLWHLKSLILRRPSWSSSPEFEPGARWNILNCIWVPLHATFHYHPFIILIWLKYFWKGPKITSHPSISHFELVIVCLYTVTTPPCWFFWWRQHLWLSVHFPGWWNPSRITGKLGRQNLLTLQEPSKIAADNTYFFLLLSLEENNAWCFMWILCMAEDSHEISSIIFLKHNEQIFKTAVCCSCDWCHKG